MPDRTDRSRTTDSRQPFEKSSLTGSAYSYTNVAALSSQTTNELADNDED